MTEPNMIVGCEEWCEFPVLGVAAIKARVDSGAKTSSIHAFNIKEFQRDGITWVSFEIHPLQRDKKTAVLCESPVVDQRVVKSSSGDTEKRYVIRSTLLLGHQEWSVELTLTNRDSMGYRMLLGREAMNHRMLINPAAKFLQGKRLGTAKNKPR